MSNALLSTNFTKEVLPAGWTWSTLGEQSEKPQYGWTTKANADKGRLKLLRTTDITSGSVDWSSVPYCTDEPDDVEKYMVKSGDVLISRAGSVGVSFLINNPERAVFASYLIRFRPKKDIDAKYFYYYLKSPAYWEAIGASKSGIAVPNVNASKLAEVSIPVAPPDQQKLIVAEIEKQFSRLDEAVANLKRVKANLKRYKAAVLKAAIEGRLVKTEAELAHREGRTYETGEQLLRRILEERRRQWKGKGQYKEPAEPDTTDLPELPEGWVWAAAVQACDPVVDCHNKTAPYTSSGILLVRTSNIREGKLLLADVRYVNQATYDFWSRRCPPQPGDVLFTREAPMGEAAIIPAGLKLCMGQRMMLMRPSSVLTAQYLLVALMSPVITRLIERIAVGTGVKHLRVGDVELLPIPIPPSLEQDRIVAEVDRCYSLYRGVEAQVDSNLQRAERLRQSLLISAFSGGLFLSDRN